MPVRVGTNQIGDKLVGLEGYVGLEGCGDRAGYGGPYGQWRSIPASPPDIRKALIEDSSFHIVPQGLIPQLCLLGEHLRIRHGVGVSVRFCLHL